MSVLTDALDTGVEGIIKIECRTSKSANILCTLTDDDILVSTFRLQRKALKESYFTLGGACTSEVDFTLTSYGVAKLKNANLFVVSTCLTIKEWVPVDDANQSTTDYSINKDGTENQTGLIKLGVFYIQELGNKPADCEVKAFDGMVALSKSITSDDLVTFQTPYSLKDRLDQIQKACLTGAYATDIASITWDTPDATDATMNTELATDKSDISTYADMLSQIGVLYGGFATFDVDGNLALVRLGVQTPLTIATNQIHGTGYDNDVSLDYSTKIAVVECSVAGFTVRKPDSVTVEPPLGVLNLPEVGLLRGCQTPRKGNDTYVMDPRIDKWLSFVKDLVINKSFTGGSITVSNRPDIKLGDVLSFSYWGMEYDTTGEGSWVEKEVTDFIVTQIDYSLNKETVLSCNSFKEQVDLGNTGSSVVEGKSELEQTIANAVLYTRNKVAKSGSQKDITVIGMNAALTAKMNTCIAVTLTLNTTGITASTDDSKAYLYITTIVDGKALPGKEQYILVNGVDTFTFVQAIEAYQVSGVHRVDIQIHSSVGNWSLDKEQAILVIMASNIASTQAEWTGVATFNESISDEQRGTVLLPDKRVMTSTVRTQ